MFRPTLSFASFLLLLPPRAVTQEKEAQPQAHVTVPDGYIKDVARRGWQVSRRTEVIMCSNKVYKDYQASRLHKMFERDHTNLDGPLFSEQVGFCPEIKYMQLVMQANDHIRANVFLSDEQWRELKTMTMRERTKLHNNRASQGEILEAVTQLSRRYFEKHAPDQVEFLHKRVELFENQLGEKFASELRKALLEKRAEHDYQHWKRLVMEADDVEGNVALSGHQWNEIEKKKEALKKELCEKLANDELCEEEYDVELETMHKRILKEVACDQVEVMEKEVWYVESMTDEVQLQSFRERLAKEKADPEHVYPTGGYYNDAFMMDCM